ncbi:hypothetical protein [Sphingomonas sp. BK069]|uniref:hypothetical protein n=1 Tax=Sphingomonas sp. BK069 TaxID=2586979 RepID=UPI00160EAC38|nr:hypothetical protein [Sphingomonas sp. BK069]MBB3346796.1 pectate lyase [Sphingomonas sp. BK069]
MTRMRALLVAALLLLGALLLPAIEGGVAVPAAAEESFPVDCDTSDAPHALPAFPGAQGFGRYARGGRGGRVIAVTTLADAGPGSLRDCAEASGARTCVFRVSGTIVLRDWIKVTQPFLTIAGQTSPGGIALRNGASGNAPMLVRTHDVVLRHFRLRPGASPRASDNVDTIQISGGAHDVILDHLSTSWPTDEGINIVGAGHESGRCGQTRNVTVQWSILAEGLNQANRGPHSRGTYFGYGAHAVTFHHNLIASNVRRNPLVNLRGQFDMIDNVIFNSVRYNAELYTRFGDLDVNAIGNSAIMGPSSEATTQLYLLNYFRDYPARFRIHLRGNLDVHRPEDRGDERLVLEPGDWRYVSTAPIGTLSMAAAEIDDAGTAYRRIVAAVGATRPRRDAADARVVAGLIACRGAVLDDPAQVGGWPALTGGAAPADRDGDGIADEWELAHGLSPTNPNDRNMLGGDGYTKLEAYLSELAGDRATMTVQPSLVPRPACGRAIADPGPLPSIALSANPAQVGMGGAVTLRWSGENIRSCKLDGAAAGETGARVVRVKATRAYEIDCIGRYGGDAIDSALVTVR